MNEWFLHLVLKVWPLDHCCGHVIKIQRLCSTPWSLALYRLCHLVLCHPQLTFTVVLLLVLMKHAQPDPL